MKEWVLYVTVDGSSLKSASYCSHLQKHCSYGVGYYLTWTALVIAASYVWGGIWAECGVRASHREAAVKILSLSWNQWCPGLGEPCLALWSLCTCVCVCPTYFKIWKVFSGFFLKVIILSSRQLRVLMGIVIYCNNYRLRPRTLEFDEIQKLCSVWAYQPASWRWGSPSTSGSCLCTPAAL